MLKYISFDEHQLMCLYSSGSRIGLMERLQEMHNYLGTEDKEIMEVIDSCLSKLFCMTDAEYNELGLLPENADIFDEMED